MAGEVRGPITQAGPIELTQIPLPFQLISRNADDLAVAHHDDGRMGLDRQLARGLCGAAKCWECVEDAVHGLG